MVNTKCSAVMALLNMGLTWTFVPPIPKLFMLTLSRRSVGQGMRAVGTCKPADLNGTAETVLIVSSYSIPLILSCMCLGRTSRIRALELDVR